MKVLFEELFGEFFHASFAKPNRTDMLGLAKSRLSAA
jgi:hypothetical protein